MKSKKVTTCPHCGAKGEPAGYGVGRKPEDDGHVSNLYKCPDGHLWDEVTGLEVKRGRGRPKGSGVKEDPRRGRVTAVVPVSVEKAVRELPEERRAELTKRINALVKRFLAEGSTSSRRGAS